MESGCSEDVQAQLEQLGINFGYMFQIRDDLLDFVSDTEEEGKLTQMDFREGILTLPVLYAMQDPQAKNRIIDLLREAKKGTFTGEHARTLKTIVAASGGLARAAVRSVLCRQLKHCLTTVSAPFSGNCCRPNVKCLRPVSVPSSSSRTHRRALQ